jgi:hypothetical protein
VETYPRESPRQNLPLPVGKMPMSYEINCADLQKSLSWTRVRFCPEFRIECDEIFRPPSLFCRILDRVGEAEAGSGGDEPAEE